MKSGEFSVGGKFDESRVDQFLALKLKGEISRSQVKYCINKGNVLLNNQLVHSANQKVSEGDKVKIDYDLPRKSLLKGEDIPLDILFEDDEVLVVNKAAGMTVHPGAGNQEHTLVHALLYHSSKLSDVGEAERPGIVHRLDKDTSGLLLVAKTNAAHHFLADQFKSHQVQRTYIAVVKGVVQHDQGRCDMPIGPGKIFKKKQIVAPGEGKEAITNFEVLERFQKSTLLKVSLETGRTHQIRVHMNFLGHPVLGDSLYGVKSSVIKRQALHAKTLGFKHPQSKEMMKFDSELPEDMENLIQELRQKS